MLESIEGLTTKKTLSPSKMRTIFKAAKLRFPIEFSTLLNTPEFKDPVNMKCRKTVFKDSKLSPLSSVLFGRPLVLVFTLVALAVFSLAF